VLWDALEIGHDRYSAPFLTVKVDDETTHGFIAHDGIYWLTKYFREASHPSATVLEKSMGP